MTPVTEAAEPVKPPPPRPLVVACVLGAIGAVVLLVGVAMSSEAVAVAGVAIGGLSFGAALFWRSELITAWRAERRGAGPTRPAGGRRTPG